VAKAGKLGSFKALVVNLEDYAMLMEALGHGASNRSNTYVAAVTVG
jgi:hypothetical protein